MADRVTPDHLLLRSARKAATLLRPVLPAHAYQTLYTAGCLGYWPRPERPQTINEKVLWLMRHHRDPLIARLADKLEARAYAVETVPGLRLPELLGVYRSAADVPFDDLPDRAVLKSTHASGHVAVLKKPVAVAAVAAKAEGWLRERYGESTLEWHYADVVPRLIVEAFLGTDDGQPPDDYKVHVMNGRAHGITVLTDRFGRFRRAPFDREWRLLPNEVHGIDRMEPPPPRPANLDALLEAAERLAAPFPYARVDFYVVVDEIVFGEITFYPQVGRVPYVDRRTDLEVGSHLTLPAR